MKWNTKALSQNSWLVPHWYFKYYSWPFNKMIECESLHLLTRVRQTAKYHVVLKFQVSNILWYCHIMEAGYVKTNLDVLRALFKNYLERFSTMKLEVWRHSSVFFKWIKSVCEKLTLITGVPEAISLADLKQKLQ